MKPKTPISAAYFTNWSIYERGYAPSQLPVDRLTHIVYAFAKTDPQTGTVTFSDPWADIDKPMDLGGKGCLGELHILKRRNRHLRVLLSIGGWTFSPELTTVFADNRKIDEFAKSAVRLVEQYSLDGLDIDWEFPTTEAQADQFVYVLGRVRLELDSLALKNSLPRDQLQLTIAAPGGEEHREVLKVKQMDRFLDFWNVMTYDFAGPWSEKVGHLANLYGGDMSGQETMRAYQTMGVHPQKLVLGMPLYGRSFTNTKGIGHSFSGVASAKWEDGVHDLRDLPMPGAQELVDHRRVAAFSQANNGTFVTYENADTAKIKAEFVQQNHLGGGMWWEASGDRPGNHSVISAFTSGLGLDRGSLGNSSSNWLKF